MKSFINFVVTLLASFVLFSFFTALENKGYREGYKEGQLDYQRDIILYELTEDGYKEVIKDE